MNIVTKRRDYKLKPINVLHLVALTGAYGTERRLLNYLKLSKNKNKNIRHHVCALRISETIASELDELSVPYIVNSIRGLKNIFSFIKYVQNNNIHILHVHNLIGHNLRTRIIPKIAGIPFIIEHEGGMVWDLNFTLPTRMTNNLVNINICNSIAGQVMLKEKCNITASVIHNGVQLIAQENNEDRNAILSDLGLSSSDHVVGFVGRLDTPKGVQAFIDMIPKIIKDLPQTKFILVGDGPMKEELISYAKRYPICDKSIKWLGFREDVRRIMLALDVLVMPSIREPFPNVLLEAAMAKLPVVASCVDGIAEIIDNGDTGILINCNTPVIKPISRKAKPIPRFVVDGKARSLRTPVLPNSDDIATAVINLLSNKDLADKISEKAFESVLARFSFDKYIENMDKLYAFSISQIEKSKVF